MNFNEYLAEALENDEELRKYYYELESEYKSIAESICNKKIEINSHGVNKLIKYNILSDERMKEIGFHKNYYEGTDYEKYSPYWYFMRKIEFPKGFRYCNISFNVHIPKDDSDIDIMILDENFCQRYDYQSILEDNPDNECANIVKEQVEKWMKYLQDSGIISGHEYGEYI